MTQTLNEIVRALSAARTADPASDPDQFCAALEAYCEFRCADLAEFQVYAGILRDWLAEEERVIDEAEAAGDFDAPAVVCLGRAEIVAAVFRNLAHLSA